MSLDTLSSRLALADLKEAEAKRRLVYVVGIEPCNGSGSVMWHAVIKAIEISRNDQFVVVRPYQSDKDWTLPLERVHDTPEGAKRELEGRANDAREAAKMVTEAFASCKSTGRAYLAAEQQHFVRVRI